MMQIIATPFHFAYFETAQGHLLSMSIIGRYGDAIKCPRFSFTLHNHRACFETAQERLLSMRIIEACSSVGRQSTHHCAIPNPLILRCAAKRSLEGRTMPVQSTDRSHVSQQPWCVLRGSPSGSHLRMRNLEFGNQNCKDQPWPAFSTS